MPFSRGRMVALMASLAVVSLAGCSSGGGTNDDGAASAAGNATSGNAGAGAGAPDDELGASVRFAFGPLDRLVGEALPETPEEYVATVRAREEGIAQCMADQGFEYVPVVPNVESVRIGGEWDPGTPAYVAEYALGVNAQPAEGAWGSISTGIVEDPNEAIVARMSDAELEAYSTAMGGALIERNAENGDTRAGGGCWDQVVTGLGTGDPAVIEAVEDAKTFLHAAYTSGVFDALNAEWAACMRGFGYVETSRTTLGETLWGWDGEDYTRPPATPEEEMDAAVADLDCRRQTHYDTRYRDLNHAQQEEYIAKNPDLAALVNQ